MRETLMNEENQNNSNVDFDVGNIQVNENKNDIQIIDENFKDNEVNSNNNSFEDNDIENDNSSDEENTEFTLPLQLGNLNNRGQFVVMTNEENLTRQSSLDLDNESFDLDLTSPTVAGSLFRMVSISESDNSNEHNNEMTLETKKSNLSLLMEKLKNSSQQQQQGEGENGNEDNGNNGWELIGARWVKKNIVSEDELKSIANLYGSNRRHQTGKKKIKRHSSAELSSYLPIEETRHRARSKSIATADFWAEPRLTNSYSDDNLNDSPSSISTTPIPSQENNTNQYDLL